MWFGLIEFKKYFEHSNMVDPGTKRRNVQSTLLSMNTEYLECLFQLSESSHYLLFKICIN